MTTRKIPATNEITCDACGGIVGKGVTNIQSGKLTLNQSALDWGGCPVADGSVVMDLCDSCLGKVASAINAVVKTIKKPTKE